MIFDRDSWKRICDGFFIRDCTIGFEDGRLGFHMVEETDDHHLDDGWKTRFVSVRMNEPMESRFFTLTGGNLSFTTISSAWAPSQTEFVMADVLCRVWSYKPKTYKGNEPEVPFDGKGYGLPDVGEIGSTINKVVRVGTSVYGVGTPLRVFQRMPNQQWHEHKGIPIPKEFKSKDRETVLNAISNSTFFDLAGFSEADMYAVGDAGIVWHFDGKLWKQIAFPTNLRLQTVTCAGDGNVYITDIRGSLWCGRGAEWKQTAKSDRSLPFADAGWFDGRLWCANDYGMMVFEGKTFVQAHQAKVNPIPTEVALLSHRFDISPDGKQMLVCGGHGAAMNRDGKWEVLFNGDDFQ
ncbi:hypothetical protein [Undibacterium sp. Xuan67W]|uniref:hypothetical protein n=1 Tax=Undibacterium sp. Xuan67W TaxID=3413057 RepID=UPI003BF457CD